jgi:hypothetical protein
MSAEQKLRASAPHSVDVAGRAMRVPDFFIVGHQKCGTSALYEMLGQHPRIFMSDVKEPRYFVPELFPPGRELCTLPGYLSLFEQAAPDQLVGDGSPQYIRSHTAAAAIAEMQPDARIVVILREPASFLRSFHLQMVHREIEPVRDLRKALALEPERRAGRRIPSNNVSLEPLMYSEHVRYAEQLERFGAAFGEDRMLVLIYDDYRADNLGTVRRVLRFLGADDTVELRTIGTRPLKEVRVPQLMRLGNRSRRARFDPSSAGAVGRTVNALTPQLLRSAAFRARWRDVVYKRPAPVDEALAAELRARYAPEVRAAGDHLGRDLLAEWGYGA